MSSSSAQPHPSPAEAPAIHLDRGQADVIHQNAERERRYTDLANAERFARCNPDTAFVKPWNQWLLFDGHRWARDDHNQVRLRATDLVRSVYLEAAAANPFDGPLAKHALQSMSEHRIRAMLSLAQCERLIAAVPSDFDPDPWLLNCANGTLDLRTGELRKAAAADCITKLSPVAYDADARCDLWDRFLERVVPDPDVREFLQRAAGYSLTGDTREEVLFFLHGPTAAGKSTFVEALKAALGDHSVTADFETFLKRPPSGGPRNDVAALAGARLVVSIEVDEGRALAEGLVKLITGGDTVTARYLYQESFEFRPQLKLWLVANSAPRARDDDAALWRRVLRVPFNVEIPEAERDPDVKAVLRDPEQAGPAVLAWAVRGCLAWQRDGLKPPDVIRRATAEYRADMDPLRDFLEERCEPDRDGWVVAAELRAAYGRFCEANGERPLQGKAFAARLLARGFSRGKHGAGGTRIWSGLWLRDAAEETTAAAADLTGTGTTGTFHPVPNNSPHARASREVLETAQIVPVAPVTEPAAPGPAPDAYTAACVVAGNRAIAELPAGTLGLLVTSVEEAAGWASSWEQDGIPVATACAAIAERIRTDRGTLPRRLALAHFDHTVREAHTRRTATPSGTTAPCSFPDSHRAHWYEDPGGHVVCGVCHPRPVAVASDSSSAALASAP